MLFLESQDLGAAGLDRPASVVTDATPANGRLDGQQAGTRRLLAECRFWNGLALTGLNEAFQLGARDHQPPLGPALGDPVGLQSALVNPAPDRVRTAGGQLGD